MIRWMIGALALLLTGCSDSAETGTFDSDGFLSAIRSESRVSQALLTSTGNIYVAVPDNGSDQKGFAMYVCEVSREFASEGVREKLVKVVSAQSARGSSSLVEIGRYWCDY